MAATTEDSDREQAWTGAGAHEATRHEAAADDARGSEAAAREEARGERARGERAPEECVEGEGAEGDDDAARWLFSGWRKAALFAVGFVALMIVGYRQQIRGKGAPIDGVRAAAIAAEPRVEAVSPTATGPSGAPAIVGAASASAAAIEDARGRAGVATADAEAAGVPPGAKESVPGPKGSATASAAGAGAGAGAAGGGKEGEAAPAAGLTADGRVVLNLATEAELRKLPGIGKARARAIIEQRGRVGKFRRLEDLLRVKGIGLKRLAQLRAKVVLDPP